MQCPQIVSAAKVGLIWGSLNLISCLIEGQPGEQWTMFFKDPSGNALEFKAMTNPENLFAKYFVS